MNRFLKLVLFGGLSLLFNNAFAQRIFYVSSDGNDADSGTSMNTPWKSLSKLSKTTFMSGDMILLRRGDVFTGQLKLISSGITVDAYGAGDNPVISGAELVTTPWVLNNGNTWETSFATGKPATINNLFEGTNRLPVSRYPNKDVNNGYLNFESHAGLTQISDNNLDGTINWIGSEMVIRTERFRLVRTTVSSHSGTSLTFPSNTSIVNLFDGYGYFFVNDLRAIDKEGEWAYQFSTGKVFLYSSTEPNSKLIYFPRTDTTVSIVNASNIIFRNIDLRYAGKLAMSLRNAASSVIENVHVSYSGGDGVVFNACSGGLLQNCSIDHVNNTGVLTNATSSQITITNNVISDIGDEAYGKSKTFIGIDNDSPGCEVSNNVISRTGYGGIISAGINNVVKRNIVDSAVLMLDDFGGIYTNYNIGVNTGMIIEENIVTNSIGERLGAPAPFSKANGIYLDNNSMGVTARNNVAAYVTGSGFLCNANQSGNKLLKNTSFGNGVSELFLVLPVVAPYYQIDSNLFITNSKSADHLVIQSMTQNYTHSQIGTFTGNCVIDCFSDTVISFGFNDGFKKTTRYMPYSWEASAPEINGTVQHPLRFSAEVDSSEMIKFFFNPTATTQNYNLPQGSFIDSWNNAYCQSVSLAPFTSLVLFRVSETTCLSVSECGQPATIRNDSVTNESVRMHWSPVEGGINYDIRYRPIEAGDWKFAHNISDTVFTLIGLTPSTTYEYQVRASCYGSEGSWLTADTSRTLSQEWGYNFINATTSNCAPSTAFGTNSGTDNKWAVIINTSNTSFDGDYIQSVSETENAPELTMTVDNILDSCGVYDIFLYYISPVTQPWQMKARFAADTAWQIFSRNTTGAELLPDIAGNTNSNRLFRAKIGTVSGVTGLQIMLDDYSVGSLSRSLFDGIAYKKTGILNPEAPADLLATEVAADHISLSWQELSNNESVFIVERKTNASAFSRIAALPANTDQYVDSNVNRGTAYTYRLLASNGSCHSGYSNEINVTTRGSNVYKSSHLRLVDNDIAGSAAGFNVYPNPFRNTLNVIVPAHFSDNGYELEITDLVGRSVWSTTQMLRQRRTTVDVGDLPNGVYLINVVSRGGERRTVKLVRN